MEECQRGEFLGRDGAEFRVECGLHKALEKNLFTSSVSWHTGDELINESIS
jgi:hypothetical protein